MSVNVRLVASEHGPKVHDSTSRLAVSATDVLVCGAILGLGIFQLYCHLRAPDFPFEDVSYFEQAKSLLQNGFYGFNSVPERVQPPGLPLLLALHCKTVGCSYGVLLSSMSVFATLGFLAWYQIIRQTAGRALAATICLILSSSYSVFLLVTSQICPSIPYFLFSGVAVWVALRLDTAQARSEKYVLSVLLALFVAISILIQTAAIALVGALLASIAISWLDGSGVALRRLKVFLPAILLGILTQFAWMHRGSNPPEWPLPGYPGSYLSQLKLKNGNYPELGFANTGDLLLRVKNNVQDRTEAVATLLTGHWVNRSFSALPMTIPLVLTMLGVVGSLWKRGENILAWYFLGYEFIYAMWPWRLDFRFLFPSLPLVCLFIYWGARNLIDWSRRYPNRISIGCLVLCIPLGVLAFLNGWAEGPSWSAGLQWNVSAVVWFALAVLSVWVLQKGRLPLWLGKLPGGAIVRRRFSAGSLSFTFLQVSVAALVVLLVIRAISQDTFLIHRNLTFGEAGLERMPDVVAARWIRLNTDPDTVIAARHVPIIYHHAQRKIVWFAPIVRPQVMLEGLLRMGVRYVVVIDRDYSYYFPPDESCFEMVEKAYPNAFRLAVQLDQVRIYEVLPKPAGAKS
jgi:hypothetical protein